MTRETLEYREALNRLETVGREMEDIGSRYFTLGGSWYIRLTWALRQVGREREADCVNQAIDIVDQNNVGYKPPRFNGNIMEPDEDSLPTPFGGLSDGPVYDLDLADAVMILDHYGFEPSSRRKTA